MDSSAGVIALCGMIELKKWASDEDEKWLEAGIRLLFKGAYANCDFTKDTQAVLQNSMELYHGGFQMVLIYGDFYLLEALMKRRGYQFLFNKDEKKIQNLSS